MAVIPTNLARVRCNFSGAGLRYPGCTTFWVDKSAMAGGGNDLGDKVNAAYLAHIKPYVSVNVVYTGCHIEWGVDGEALSYDVGANIPGGVAGETAPSNVAYLAVKTGAIGGRHGRGRNYWPGVPESLVTTGGSLTGVANPGWSTACQDFFDKLATDDIIMSMAWESGGVWADVPLVSYEGALVVATQRRRLRR